MSGASASGAGVQVPGGNPDALSGAADYHYQLADGLEYHAGTMDNAAGALYGVWSGEAAGSYQALSADVANHFRATARTSRTVADELRRWADQLRQYQNEGEQALKQAVYWLDQVRQWGERYGRAQTAVHDAQLAVSRAQAQFIAASRTPSDGAAGAAWSALTGAQGQLTQAQGELKICGEELRNAEHELIGWQKRGHQIWQDAQSLADRATGTLDATCVAPPPLAAGLAPGVGDLGSRGGAVKTALTIAGDLQGAVAAFGTGYAGRMLRDSEGELKALRDAWAGVRNGLAGGGDLTNAGLDAWAHSGNAVNDARMGMSELTQLDHTVAAVGAVGGVIDAGLHMAEGDSVSTSVEKGAASGLAGTVGAWGGGAACTALGAPEAAPLCAGVGGAIGGFLGDTFG